MLTYFKTLTDPRISRRKAHNLLDIIGVTICAILSGCNNWNDIALYGEIKCDFLKQFLKLPHGIPSHDTFNRVFSILNPKEVQQCFLAWVQNIAEVTNGRIVSIDGKRLRNSGTDGGKGFVHLVNAWCDINNMVIGQEKTDEKSNEITAIPKLLDLLILHGAIVTIDAMGCQTAIASKIVAQDADYVLAVKDNQKHLLDDIKEAFEQTPKALAATTLEKSHGRIEKRTCRIITDMDWISKLGNWENLHTIIEIKTKRIFLKTQEEQQETRYYISSLISKPEHFNTIVRKHWGVENKLHWSLDVIFKEDLSTKQAGNAAENFAIMTKIALNLLKNNTTRKISVNSKRLLCGMDNDFLTKTVFKEI
jgi:predicted transposase YbfD/YdcC